MVPGVDKFANRLTVTSC